MDQSNHSITAILNSIANGIMAMNKNGYCTFINQNAIQLLQLPDNYTGQHVLERIDIFGVDFCTACKNVLTTQKPFLVACYFPLQKIALQNEIYPSSDGITVVFKEVNQEAIFADGVTQQKLIQAEKEIQKSVELFSLVTRATNDMIWDWNLLTNKVWWNNNYSNLFGYENATNLFHIDVWAKNIHSEDKERVLAGIYKVIQSGEKYWTDEYRYLKKDGTIVYIYDRGYVAHNEEGKPHRMIGCMLDISERIQAETEIKKLNERFSIVTLATNDMIWDWNLHTDELWWNYNYNTLFGYDYLSPIHSISAWVNSVHAEDRERVKEGIYKIINSGEKYWTDEYRYIKKDGTVLFIYDRGYVLYDETGKPYRMIGSMLNITERIKAENAIKESEEKYRTLVEQASDAIYIIDTQANIITVNHSACSMSGYSEQELLQMNLYDFVTKEYIEKEPFRFAELKLGKTILQKRKLIIKNGALLNIECTSNMLSNGNVLVFAKDITERLKIEEDIIKEKNLSDSVINSLPGIFYLHDAKGTLLRWNKNFERITGHTATSIRNTSILDFFDASQAALLRQKSIEVLEKGTADGETLLLTKDNEKRPYYVNGWKTVYEEKVCVIAVGIDITEKMEAEKKLKKSYQDIRSLAAHLTKIREEERRRIGREIHDELGQQLTAIKMDVAWIDKKITDENDLIKAKLKNMITLLDGSNQSVRRILTELNPGIIDNQGLVEALERLNRQFTTTTSILVSFKTIAAKITLSQDIANCIFRVYQESLTNIMRYAQATTVSSSLKIVGDNIVVTIEDDGKGFDRTAVQAKQSFGILGMKERVLSQGGTFDLQSEDNRGTKIIIILPHK
jgi:PAS domain S-box-containing protein